MPRASANIKAKLSAQIETGVNFVVITSAPAATRRPAMVRSRGRPAATRLPKAMTKMMMVTGHESISDRSMADRLALLKLDHRALSPVNVTVMPGRDRAPAVPPGIGRFDHVVRVGGSPRRDHAVRPSRDSEIPAWGGTTVDTR